MQPHSFPVIEADEFDAAFAYLGLNKDDLPAFDEIIVPTLNEKQAKLLISKLIPPTKQQVTEAFNGSIINVPAAINSVINPDNSQTNITTAMPSTGINQPRDFEVADLYTDNTNSAIGKSKEIANEKETTKSKVFEPIKSLAKSFSRFFHIEKKVEEQKEETIENNVKYNDIADNYEALDGSNQNDFSIDGLKTNDQIKISEVKNQTEYHTIYEPITTQQINSYVIKGDDEETDDAVGDEQQINNSVAQAEKFYCLFNDDLDYYGDKRALATVLFYYYSLNNKNITLFLKYDLEQNKRRKNNENSLAFLLLKICNANVPSSSDVTFSLNATSTIVRTKEDIFSQTITHNNIFDDGLSMFMAPFGCFYAALALSRLMIPGSMLTNQVIYATTKGRDVFVEEVIESNNNLLQLNFDCETTISSVSTILNTWKFFSQQQTRMNGELYERSKMLASSVYSGAATVTNEETMEKNFYIMAHSFMYNFLFNPRDTEKIFQGNAWDHSSFVNSFKNISVNIPNLHNNMDNSAIGWELQLNARTALIGWLFNSSFDSTSGRFIIASYPLDDYAIIKNYYNYINSDVECECECDNCINGFCRKCNTHLCKKKGLEIFPIEFLLAHEIIVSVEEGERTLRYNNIISKSAQYIVGEAEMEHKLLFGCEGLLKALCERLHTCQGTAFSIFYKENENSTENTTEACENAYEKIDKLIKTNEMNSNIANIVETIDWLTYDSNENENENKVDESQEYIETNDCEDLQLSDISTLELISQTISAVLRSTSILRFQSKFNARPLPSLLAVLKACSENENDFTMSDEARLNIICSINSLLEKRFIVNKTSMYVSIYQPSIELQNLTKDCDMCLNEIAAAKPSLNLFNNCISDFNTDNNNNKIKGELYIETAASLFSETDIFSSFLDLLISNSLVLSKDVTLLSTFYMTLKVIAQCANNGNLRNLLISYSKFGEEEANDENYNVFIEIAKKCLDVNLFNIHDNVFINKVREGAVEMLSGLSVDEEFKNILRLNEEILYSIYFELPDTTRHCINLNSEKIDEPKNDYKQILMDDNMCGEEMEENEWEAKYDASELIAPYRIKYIKSIIELARVLTLDTSNLINFELTDFEQINLSMEKSLTKQGKNIINYIMPMLITYTEEFGKEFYDNLYNEFDKSADYEIELKATILTNLTTVLSQIAQIVVPVLPFLSVQTNLTILRRKFLLSPKSIVPVYLSGQCYKLIRALLLSCVSIFATSGSIKNRKVMSSSGLRVTALSAFALYVLQTKFNNILEFDEFFLKDKKFIEESAKVNELLRKTGNKVIEPEYPNDICNSELSLKFAAISCLAIAKFYADDEELHNCDDSISNLISSTTGLKFEEPKKQQKPNLAEKENIDPTLNKSIVKKIWEKMIGNKLSKSAVNSASKKEITKSALNSSKIFNSKVSQLMDQTNENKIIEAQTQKRWSRRNICFPKIGENKSKLFIDFGDILGGTMNGPKSDILNTNLEAFNKKAQIIRGVSNDTILELLRFLASATTNYPNELEGSELLLERIARNAYEVYCNAAKTLAVFKNSEDNSSEEELVNFIEETYNDDLIFLRKIVENTGNTMIPAKIQNK